MISDPHRTVNIDIGNSKIPVWLYGNPKNTPIIFIHGFYRGFSEYIGDLPPRYLKKKYYVVAFDLPGFGHSKYLKINNLELLSRVQKEILVNKKAVFFGVSYGGLLSLKYASENPSRVSKIIIAGTPVFSGIFSFAKILLIRSKYRKLLKEFTYIRSENLSKIKQPVLLYYDKSDYVANVFMGKKLNKLIPNSKIFITSGLNHKWLLHRIDKNGLLTQIEDFI